MVLPVRGHSRVLPVETAHFDNVALGKEGISKLPNGPTYELLIIETNVPVAGIDAVILNMGGNINRGEIINVTGADLLKLWDYKNLPAIHGAGPTYFYAVPLASVESATEPGEQFSGLVTLSTDNNTVKVRINPAASVVDGNGDAATPYLKLHAWASAAREVRKFIPVIKSQTVVNNQTGVFDHPNLPAEQGVYYRRLFIEGAVDQVEIKRDKVSIWPATELQSAAMHQVVWGRKPPADTFVVDFCPEGYVFRDLFNPRHVNQLVLKMRFTNTGNARILYEAVEELNPYESASGARPQGA